MDITEVTIPTLMGSQRAPVKNKQKTDLVSETVQKPVESQSKPSREMSPPLQYGQGAETIRSVRKEAISSPMYIGSVLPFGYWCVKKQEKVVFLDGTVYSLTASWAADPILSMIQKAGLQTSPEKVEVSDKESPTKEVTKPNTCIPEETIIDLTMSDEEDSGSDTLSETDTAAESDESNVETVRVVINCEDSDI
ncbi:unnamed protein product [Mytilus edulis]|uniref:Uncharacterized protein n=1 Tax=Mytilus edulis TaxID=6550 RepID=A0A8S3QWT8_MYTED|nr:unnamed protein product [Mytilus edulis]